MLKVGGGTQGGGMWKAGGRGCMCTVRCGGGRGMFGRGRDEGKGSHKGERGASLGGEGPR